MGMFRSFIRLLRANLRILSLCFPPPEEKPSWSATVNKVVKEYVRKCENDIIRNRKIAEYLRSQGKLPQKPQEQDMRSFDGPLTETKHSLFHHEADFMALLDPNFSANLAMLARNRGMNGVLELDRKEYIDLVVLAGSTRYGNELRVNPFRNVLDAIRAGYVIEVDGLPIFPRVSDYEDIQARYRAYRKEGLGHKDAQEMFSRYWCPNGEWRGDGEAETEPDVA